MRETAEVTLILIGTTLRGLDNFIYSTDLFGSCDKYVYAGSTYWRNTMETFSNNSVAKASEFLENLEKIFLVVISLLMRSQDLFECDPSRYLARWSNKLRYLHKSVGGGRQAQKTCLKYCVANQYHMIKIHNKVLILLMSVPHIFRRQIE